MELKDIVTSLKLSKALKRAGVPQESLHMWLEQSKDKPRVFSNTMEIPILVLGSEWSRICAAYSTDELLEWLDSEYGENLIIERVEARTYSNPKMYWYACFREYEHGTGENIDMPVDGIKGDSLIETLAKLLLWCIKEGHVSFKKSKLNGKKK